MLHRAIKNALWLAGAAAVTTVLVVSGVYAASASGRNQAVSRPVRSLQIANRTGQAAGQSGKALQPPAGVETVFVRSAAEMKDELASRRTLDRAKGLLMQREGISELEAYHRLQQRAREQRQTLLEAAQESISSTDNANKKDTSPHDLQGNL